MNNIDDSHCGDLYGPNGESNDGVNIEDIEKIIKYVANLKPYKVNNGKFICECCKSVGKHTNDCVHLIAKKIMEV